MTCWNIWKARCKTMFEGKMPNPATVVEEIKQACDEIKGLQRVGPVVLNIRETQGWRASTPGTVKVNCDAAWYNQTMLGGISVVARTSDGRIVRGAN